MAYFTMPESFPDYDPADLPPIPEGWVDSSYSNDTCPSFEPCEGLAVYIDYKDPAMREFAELGEAERFNVIEFKGDTKPVFWSDDWQAVLDFVANYDPVKEQ